ncbi:MAG: lysophospholipid acyltransferase family protein [Candidatus Omnitrophica bacterium]|nr:lysophospholipid acyltransferase family protein [Candidatus Omnitrophota bacterium]
MKIKTRRYYIYYILKIGGFFIAVFPLRIGLFMATVVGRLIFIFGKKERRTAIDNLRNSFPEKSETEIRDIAISVFINLCKNGVEWVNMHYKLNAGNIDRWVTVEGRDIVDRALSRGNGVLMLASHFGNWELIPVYFLLKGYYGGVIARRIYFKGYDNFISGLRTSKGAIVVYRDESPKKILKILKNNGIVGILADQDVDSVDGVFVDFFGRKAYTPKAPVALAMASGAALIPCFMIREKNGHRLIVEKPIEIVEKTDKEDTIKLNTQAWSQIIERYIRKYPEQWVWIHRRWKTAPHETLPEKAESTVHK